jgi:pimeloyl-ACP methyl ester carboxylesterase
LSVERHATTSAGHPPRTGGEGSLLGRFGGRRPPAAAWFEQALTVAPQRSAIDVEGAAIELLVWGERGKPGLLFLHGNGAHADWWSFIAPFFAADYRCAAISWSGMGGSGWRPRYAIETFGQEVLAAIDAAELDRGGRKPVLIGHSFGGSPLMHVAANHGERIAAGIMLDSFVPRPNRKPGWITSGRPTRRYPELADALARYRFAPEQPSDWPEIVDHLARASLRHLPAEGDQPAGWTWRFDPNLWTTMDRSGIDALVERIEAPIALIYGEQSSLVSAELVAGMRDRLPNCPIAIAIPGARHHIMVDQPLALVAALRVAIPALHALSEAR